MSDVAQPEVPVEGFSVRIEYLALVASLFFMVACNGEFWSSFLEDRSLSVPGTWSMVLCAALILVGGQWFWLMGILNRWTVKPLLGVLTLGTAAAVYYMTRLHIYLDEPMIRNVLETDVKEASELIQPGLIPHLAFYLVLPLVLLWRVRIRREPLKRALPQRLGFMALALGLAAGGLWGGSHSLIPIFRDHRELLSLITPSNYVHALGRIVTKDTQAVVREREIVGADARKLPRREGRRPVAFVIILGEAVRAANWGLDGYERQTTPKLAARGVVNFPDVTACGTDTATAVPCMFSPFGRHDYDREHIRSADSVFDVLHRAGVTVHWLDNQAGSKGTMALLGEEHADQVCVGGDRSPYDRYYDHAMIPHIRRYVEAAPGDVVVVIHMLGNHGPAYYQRYPPEFRRWTPTADSGELGDWSREALVNTYDNCILYTDHVIDQAITLLEGLPSHDTALMYVGDHGESLGEYNLYLHGVPYAIAPSEQTKIPWIFWFSPGFEREEHDAVARLRRRVSTPVSHDFIFHTLLSLFDVATTAKDPAFDLTSD